MVSNLGGLAAPTRVIPQALPTPDGGDPAIIQWRVSVLTPSEMLNLPALASAFEGGLIALNQKARGLSDDGEASGTPDNSVQRQFFGMLSEIAGQVITAVSVDGGQTWEAVTIVASRKDENATEGRIFVGLLEMGTTPNGESILGSIFEAAFGAMTEAQKKVGNFRPQQGG